MNSDEYVQDILEPFFEELTDEERQHGCFQQDGAIAQITNNSVIPLQEVFDDRIINTGLWAPISAALSVCDFYLWGSLKAKVYRDNPALLKPSGMRLGL
jgi:hypothetical protein